MKKTFLLLVIFIFAMTEACTSSTFSGDSQAKKRGRSNSSGQSGVKVGSDPNGDPNNGLSTTVESGINDIKNSDLDRLLPLSLKAELSSSLTENSVWVAQTDTSVYRIILDKAKGYPVTKWTGALSDSGRRTFISEVGLLVCGTARGLYRVADDVPVPGQAQFIWNGGLSADSRCCPTSFIKDGKPYVGVGYKHTDGKLKFTRFPIDKTVPSKVDVSKAETFVMSDDGGIGTYSCYTDQTRNYYWSKNWQNIHGIDMISGTPLDYTAMPNYGRKFSAAGVNVDNAVDNAGNYSLQGDTNGNLLTSVGIYSSYTMAYDPIANVVVRTPCPPGYGTAGGSAVQTLTIIHGDCFKKGDLDCTNKAINLPMDKFPGIGPLSSLNDGRIVALQRFGGGAVYIFSMVDTTNPAAGMAVEKIAELPSGGAAYMYADFTGSMLYAATKNHVFDLTTHKDFIKGRAVQLPKLVWNSESGKTESWKALKLSARCFKDASIPEFTVIGNVPDSGEQIDLLKIPSCAGSGMFDKVEIKIEPDGTSGAFSKTKLFEFYAKQ